MRAWKYIGTFLVGFIFAIVILHKNNQAQFDYGFQNGVLQGRMDAVDAVQKMATAHTSFSLRFTRAI